MKLSIAALTIAASLATVLAFGPRAHAFTLMFPKCNGSYVKWRPVGTVHRNTCSIATTGSQDTAFTNGWGEWQGVSGIFGQPVNNPVTDCTWDAANDGQNEVSRVARTMIDSNDGKTFLSAGPCFIGANNIDEADVLIADDMPMDPGTGINIDQINHGNNSNNGNVGRTAFVHEMGHFLGFNHSADQSQLFTPGMGPITGGTEVGQEAAVIWPDDMLALNTVYSTFSFPNLMSSATSTLSGSLVLLDPVSQPAFCQGATFTSHWYLANGGKINSGTYNFRIRFSDGVASEDVIVPFTHSINAFSEGTFTISFPLPSTLLRPTLSFLRIYSVFLEMDPANALQETREGDNKSKSPIAISMSLFC